MKEFHLHLTKNEYSQQAFLFFVSRDDKEKTLQIHEIAIVTQCNGIETKSLLNLDVLSNLMGINKGGNLVPQSYPDIHNLFHDMLGPNGKETMDQQMRTFVNSEYANLEQLLNAAEVAKDLHPTLSIQEIVDNMFKNTKNP